MKHIAHFPLQDLLPMVGLGQPKMRLETMTGVFRVKASSSRMECLRRNPSCVRCKRSGSLWVLESCTQKPPRMETVCFIDDCPWCSLRRQEHKKLSTSMHLNLYHVRANGSYLLMTQDHIMPQWAGGSNDQDNLQTMCQECNSLKGGMLPAEWKASQLYLAD